MSHASCTILLLTSNLSRFETAFSGPSGISETYAAVRELLSDEDKISHLQNDALNSQPPAATENINIPFAAKDCLAGLTFTFIGELGSVTRDEGYAIVKRYSGKITLDPSSRTSYVVLGNGVGPKKLKTIKKFKLKTINEDGLFELIRRLLARGDDENATESLGATDVNGAETLKLANWAISKLESVMSSAGNPCGKDGSILVDYLIWREGRLDCFTK